MIVVVQAFERLVILQWVKKRMSNLLQMNECFLFSPPLFILLPLDFIPLTNYEGLIYKIFPKLPYHTIPSYPVNPTYKARVRGIHDIQTILVPLVRWGKRNVINVIRKSIPLFINLRSTLFVVRGCNCPHLHACKKYWGKANCVSKIKSKKKYGKCLNKT